jgi:AraC-like DNA-binding protein
MDVVDEILDSLRLTGGVVVDASARGDWCMISQFTPESCARYFPVPGTLVGYHYIRSGQLWVEVQEHEPVHVREGTVLVFPRNDRHLLYTRQGLTPVDADDLLEPGKDGGPATIRIEGPGNPVEIYCGFLGLSEYRHPLFDSLPRMLVLDPHDESGEWVASSMRFLSTDRSPGMVARLAQLFVGHAIKQYLDGAEDLGGWAAGLRDVAVGKALYVIHNRYSDDLDVEMLAREAGVSRTILCDRFAELIGEPPMRYCARWRMRMAANMLREGKENTANVAYAVGFNSEAAFNRAFKREFGEPPATWKRHLERAPSTRASS